MNYFNRKKVVIAIIVILLAMNIATISTIVYFTYKHPKKERVSRFKDWKRGWEELGLTEEQEEKAANEREVYWKSMKEIFLKQHQNRMDMMKVYELNGVDTAQIIKLANERGELEKEIQILTMRYMQRLEKIMSPEQFSKMTSLYKTVFIKNDRFHKNRFNKGGRDRRDCPPDSIKRNKR